MLRRWAELTSPGIGALDGMRGVAVLPLGATEQHGPHLPTGTDTMIAEGIVAEAAKLISPQTEAVLMPTLAVGASLEHRSFPGTLSFSAARLIDVIVALGGGVAASGLKKLLLLSSHGGNNPAVSAAALELRARYGLVAVATSLARFGLPEALADDAERSWGIHGGFVETSLMLHLQPALVRREALRRFASRQEELVRRHRHLRAHGPVGYGWLAEDLNPAGAVGDAAAASAEAGAAIARHQALGLAGLIDELSGAAPGDLVAAK
ncbi:creatininase family protein [Afifella pfennigii]|uniref:creatininase family protein n=1 Tax=Afifella pfennigii TaxID=209897 RepID=UPI0004790C84|nr:creatininase family protein [Afifella pfennigii]